MVERSRNRLLDGLQQLREGVGSIDAQFQGNGIDEGSDEIFQLRLLPPGYGGSDDDRLLLAYFRAIVQLREGDKIELA